MKAGPLRCERSEVSGHWLLRLIQVLRTGNTGWTAAYEIRLATAMIDFSIATYRSLRVSRDMLEGVRAEESGWRTRLCLYCQVSEL